MQDVYSLFKPKTIDAPVIFDSPHSGICAPDNFNSLCDALTLAHCADLHVEALFAGVPALGAPLLTAQISRVVIDVNRAPCDIDPLLLEAPWSPEEAINPTDRSAQGIGLIRRLIAVGRPVYARSLSQQEIERRIELFYRPYHQALQTLLEDSYARHGQVYHINCHSMPDEAAQPRRPIGFTQGRGQRADFVLGDRDATSCDPAFTRAVRDYIAGLGYHVTINDPFKGVELLARYSDPARGRHSLQIEINKRLYMNEATGEHNANFPTLQADINKISAFIIEYASAQKIPLAAD